MQSDKRIQMKIIYLRRKAENMFEDVCVLCISCAGAQYRRYTEWIIRPWPGQVSVILPMTAANCFFVCCSKTDLIGEK